MIEILPARWDDLPLLQSMAIETQVATFGAVNSKENMQAFLQQAYNLPQLQKEFNEPDSLYAMAWYDREAAGFLRVRKTDEAQRWLGKNALELQRIYVLEKFQGKRIGSMLLEYSLDFARKNSYEWLWLGVWEHNLKAQQFYSQRGFTRFSEHIFQMGTDAQTDWLLKLKL